VRFSPSGKYLIVFFLTPRNTYDIYLIDVITGILWSKFSHSNDIIFLFEKDTKIAKFISSISGFEICYAATLEPIDTLKLNLKRLTDWGYAGEWHHNEETPISFLLSPDEKLLVGTYVFDKGSSWSMGIDEGYWKLGIWDFKTSKLIKDTTTSYLFYTKGVSYYSYPTYRYFWVDNFCGNNLLTGFRSSYPGGPIHGGGWAPSQFEFFIDLWSLDSLKPLKTIVKVEQNWYLTPQGGMDYYSLAIDKNCTRISAVLGYHLVQGDGHGGFETFYKYNFGIYDNVKQKWLPVPSNIGPRYTALTSDGNYLIINSPLSVWDINTTTKVYDYSLSADYFQLSPNDRYLAACVNTKLYLFRARYNFPSNVEIESQDVAIFPDSYDNFARIKIFRENPEWSTISVLNVLGMNVQSFSQYLDRGLNTINIDLSNLPNGLYFVKVSGTTQHSLFKLIVNK
jgi:hypothetical protein